MVDIATLGYSVDTTGLLAGKAALAEFQGANYAAADATDRMSVSLGGLSTQSRALSRADALAAPYAALEAALTRSSIAAARHGAAIEGAAGSEGLMSRESIRLQQHIAELGAGLAAGDVSLGRLAITGERVAYGLGRSEGGLGGTLAAVGAGLLEVITPAAVAVGAVTVLGAA
ncbi:MAG: hypothetical protein ACHQAY_05320, partial [Hyphomicrobiales bacterium]